MPKKRTPKQKDNPNHDLLEILKLAKEVGCKRIKHAGFELEFYRPVHSGAGPGVQAGHGATTAFPGLGSIRAFPSGPPKSEAEKVVLNAAAQSELDRTIAVLAGDAGIPSDEDLLAWSTRGPLPSEARAHSQKSQPTPGDSSLDEKAS